VLHPSVTYLKPPLPGAALSDAGFLDDGRLALQVVLPDGERQSWTLEPAAHFASQRLGDVASHAPLAVRPDAQAVAVLQPRSDVAATNNSPAFSDRVSAGEIWLVPTGDSSAPRRVWTTPELTEDLVDLDWAPDGQHLIVVGRQPVSGGAARTATHWLDVTTGEGQVLALLPSEIAQARMESRRPDRRLRGSHRQPGCRVHPLCGR
jgi:hypothetical protein